MKLIKKLTLNIQRKKQYNNLKNFIQKDFLINKKFNYISKELILVAFKKQYFSRKIKIEKYFFFLGKRFPYEIFKRIKNFRMLLFGISLKRVFKYFIVSYGVNMNYMFTKEINLDFLKKMQKFIINSKVNLNLRRDILKNLLIKKQLKTYQSIRFKNNLPIRGQRSYTNAGTSKRLNFYK